MKFLMMIVAIISTIFIIQISGLKAALLPNEIEILESSVKHGPRFGEGWSEEQKIVWNKTQTWWQLRMAADWSKLINLYHKDAILYDNWHYDII